MTNNFDGLKGWLNEGYHSKEISRITDKKLVLSSFLNGLKIINNILLEKKFIEHSLEEINNKFELRNLEKKFFEDPEIKELNDRGKGLYYASFRFFLKYKNKLLAFK